MKYTIISSIILMLGFPNILTAQAPQAINYQAAVRDADGKPIVNDSLDFTIEIIQTDIDSVVFSELHEDEPTGDFGIVNFQIGSKNPIGFSEINWSAGKFKIRISIDANVIDEAQIVAVPFALYAEKAGNSFWKKNANGELYYIDSNVLIGRTDSSDTLEVTGTISVRGTELHEKIIMYATDSLQEKSYS